MNFTKPIDFEVNGYQYQTLPIKGMDALELDRKVLGIWSKLLQRETPAADLVSGFSSVFSEMPRKDFEELVLMTLSSTTALGGTGVPNVRLTGDAIAEHFADHKADFYNVLIAVWEANKLSPFA